ncbi:hypothetical protein [Psychrobacillus lasiicapitis]|uniref:Uncharacterized protein n=1 Tax=Psychrobacillus lasiicapitis TaxID=1636719 RepID=A0A544TA88_9BACI|nr:hypothetical protein [Psychrobacillus lasiicapitis]TQR14377.1 hypothetical protein FG382_07930 [Psychrobacillus lasiicapitis]GGA31862.1 hypothetical protein GCM10011384_21770 [Psychrobacillus lasiicapitis]
MSFVDELQKEHKNAIIAHALEIAEKVEPTLRESASKGYTGSTFSLEGRDDAHILKDSLFLESLETLLDGCEVKIIKDEYTNILLNRKFYKSKLYIGWAKSKEALDD